MHFLIEDKILSDNFKLLYVKSIQKGSMFLSKNGQGNF